MGDPNECNVDGLAGRQGFKIRMALWSGRDPRKSQKEGQQDQGTLNQLRGVPLARLPLSVPPGLPSGSSIRQAILISKPERDQEEGRRQPSEIKRAMGGSP